MEMHGTPNAVMPYVSVAIGSKDWIPKTFITRIQRFHYNPSRTTMTPAGGRPLQLIQTLMDRLLL